MENDVLPDQTQAVNPDQILKVTALLYLQEALATQEYETCPELIETAKSLGVDAGAIKAVIANYLERDNAVNPAPSRLRSYKEK